LNRTWSFSVSFLILWVGPINFSEQGPHRLFV